MSTTPIQTEKHLYLMYEIMYEFIALCGSN